eukprot:1157388-Pelagomonas_calceolata.AAC.20
MREHGRTMVRTHGAYAHAWAPGCIIMREHGRTMVRTHGAYAHTWAPGCIMPAFSLLSRNTCTQA